MNIGFIILSIIFSSKALLKLEDTVESGHAALAAIVFLYLAFGV